VTTSAPTPLPLASVCDTDCLFSRSPLVLKRMPGQYVYGVQAVLRRVLYGWLLPPVLVYDRDFGEALVNYEGMTLSDVQILGLKGRLEASARAEDYVLAASVAVALVGTSLSVAGRIALVDGRAYPLEVGISNAGAALDALGI